VHDLNKTTSAICVLKLFALSGENPQRRVTLLNELKGSCLCCCCSRHLPASAMDSPTSGSKVSDPQHSQKLLAVLRTFWQEQSFHDALLVVDGEELPVQKNILAAASPYVR